MAKLYRVDKINCYIYVFVKRPLMMIKSDRKRVFFIFYTCKILPCHVYNYVEFFLTLITSYKIFAKIYKTMRN